MKDAGKITQNMADEPSGEGTQGTIKTDVTPLKHCHSYLTMFLLLTLGNFKTTGHIAQKLKEEENILIKIGKKGQEGSLKIKC
jgi:hypothetical protein